MIRFEKRKEIESLQKEYIELWFSYNTDSISETLKLKTLNRKIKMLKRDLDK